MAPQTIRVTPAVQGKVHMFEGPGDAPPPWTQGLHMESARLASFHLYLHVPPSGVWVTRLVAAGFYCPDRNSTSLRCAFCDITVDISSFVNRNPTELHRVKSPACPFVTGTADNNTTLQQCRQISGRHLKQLVFGATSEQKTPPLPATSAREHEHAERPASQPSEPTRAQTTGNALPNQTARPVGTHRQEVASSSRTTETLGRNTTNQSGSNSNIASATAPAAPAPQSPPPSTTEPPRQLVTYSQLGIYTQEPKRHDFAIATTRMNTYTGWPHSSTHTPEDMTEAGFYYVGQSDLVRCFYCKGGLKSWTGSLRPWVEHARFYPKCPFVGQVKGQEFVDVVQELKAKQDTISEAEVEAELKKRQRQTPGNNNDKQVEATVDIATDEAEEMPEGAVDGTLGGANNDDDNLEPRKTADELEDENLEIKSERICKICQVDEVSILFLPCGHLASCAQCAPALRTCAICRQRVKGRVRVIDEDE